LVGSKQHFVPWPLVQHPHALADGQPDARPLFDRALEDAPGFLKVVASIEHQLDPQSVAASLLDLVEV
jgi:hypothetical protein